jgi:hypothetical protein
MHKRYSESLRKLIKKKLPKHNGKLGTLPPIDDIHSHGDNSSTH